MFSHKSSFWMFALVILCVAVATLITFAFAAAEPEHNEHTAPNREIEQAIHDYILAHPEVLIESLRLAKNREYVQQQAAAKSAIGDFKKELIEDPISPVLGNPKGDVTVVEFFDYRCPYCRQMDPFLQTLAKDDLGVRIVQKQFPVLGPESIVAARAALAANMQGKLLEFHNGLMTKRTNFDEASILALAQSVGLDVERLKKDMASSQVTNEISRNIQIAKALKITGTPGFVVGSQVLPGATDLQTLKELVIDARHEASN